MAPDESDGTGPGDDVTIEIDVGALADVVVVQIAAQFQPDRWHVCGTKKRRKNGQFSFHYPTITTLLSNQINN